MKTLINIFHKIKSFNKIIYKRSDSRFFIDNHVALKLQKDSHIHVYKNVVIGHKQEEYFNIPTLSNANIRLAKGARIIFKGSCLIGPGCFINVGENAELVIGDDVVIGNNVKIICNKKIEIKNNVLISWNVTLIDDDKHLLKNLKSNKVKKLSNRPLIINEDVGIGMSSSIIKGVNVGKNVSILSFTVVDKDLKPDSVAYFKRELKSKHGYKVL